MVGYQSRNRCCYNRSTGGHSIFRIANRDLFTRSPNRIRNALGEVCCSTTAGDGTNRDEAGSQSEDGRIGHGGSSLCILHAHGDTVLAQPFDYFSHPFAIGHARDDRMNTLRVDLADDDLTKEMKTSPQPNWRIWRLHGLNR